MDTLGGKMHGIQFPIVDVAALDDNFQHVPEETAIFPNGQIVASEGAFADLDHFRLLFPFMPIMPVPTNIASVIVTVANTAYPLTFPDGTQLVHFAGDGTGDYWISFDGAAAVPTQPIIDANPGGKLAFFKPDYTWFYVSGMRQISVTSPTAGRIVQAHCYIVNSRPK